MTESKPENNVSGLIEKFEVKKKKLSVSKLAMIIAAFPVITRSFSGALFGYSEEWQSVISKGTAI